MRLATVIEADGPRIGIVHGDEVVILPASSGTVDDVVRGGPEVLAQISVATGAGNPVPVAAVRLGAPLRRFNRDILCTGWNYWDHFEESRGLRDGQDPPSRPEHPTFFTKGPDTVIGPHDDIAFDPAISAEWDYEAELALVIGRDCRSVSEEDAMAHVFGLCVANDVSQRDLQRAHGGQWLKGKSIDRTMPLGPWLTTIDEVPDPAGLTIQCEVNEVRLQDASTAQMAFSLSRLIAELSWGMTLRAGDVVITGTPSGIGNAREPQVFLQAGDLVVTRVVGLGELRNRVTLTTLS